MIRRPPRSTRTDTLFPYTTLFRSRDSPLFKDKVRDLEYASTLRIARDQLELGMNVAFPGPWSREQASGALFSIPQLGLPPETQLPHVWLELPLEVRKDRIRSEVRRVGKGCVSKFRFRWWPSQ